MLTMTRKKGDIIKITTIGAAEINIHVGKKPPTRCGDANLSIDADKSVHIKYIKQDIAIINGKPSLWGDKLINEGGEI